MNLKYQHAWFRAFKPDYYYFLYITDENRHRSGFFSLHFSPRIASLTPSLGVIFYACNKQPHILSRWKLQPVQLIRYRRPVTAAFTSQADAHGTLWRQARMHRGFNAAERPPVSDSGFLNTRRHAVLRPTAKCVGEGEGEEENSLNRQTAVCFLLFLQAPPVIFST